MFKPERISKLCEERKMTRKRLCDLSGITTATLNRVTDHGSDIGASKLDRIADVLKVPVSYFFESEYTYSGNTLRLCDSGNEKPTVQQMTIKELIGVLTDKETKEELIKECMNEEPKDESDSKLLAYYKSLLEEKERIIQLLMKINNISLPSVTPFEE